MQGTAELEALLEMSTDPTRAGELELISFGTGIAGHDNLLKWQDRRVEEQQVNARAALAKVAKPPPMQTWDTGAELHQHRGPPIKVATPQPVMCPVACCTSIATAAQSSRWHLHTWGSNGAATMRLPR